MNKTIAATASALLLSFAAVAPSQAAQLVTNGTFETGLSGWTQAGQVDVLTASQYGPCCGVVGTEPAYSSNHFAALGGGNVAGVHSLSQMLATVVGQTYNLTFDAGAFGGGVNVLIASLGGIMNSYTLTANNNADTTFSSYGFNFTGTGGDLLTFAVNTGADNTDALVDNISVIGPGAVPEPATWAMMIMGFVGLGSLLRSRRKEGLAIAA